MVLVDFGDALVLDDDQGNCGFIGNIYFWSPESQEWSLT